MPLLTVELPPGSVLADALQALGLAEDEVDREYGLIAVDPDAGRFALRVGAAAAARLTGSAARVFADPPVGSSTPDEPADRPKNPE
ncbi:hypothetical protein [Nocardia flavorosea]|uniref:Uncharacterized protein n=1 Tax=Nocardia flavorosea TaxID=53429 RepID=A0A846YII8_9NOCA|nr:hypothetical protein [Nocardia flavorosea]NKY57392.1 hypothetical protein [Nocardia flavorosea]